VRKFIAIGLNYRDHAEEAGMSSPVEPIIFHKAISCLNGPDYDLLQPRDASHFAMFQPTPEEIAAATPDEKTMLASSMNFWDKLSAYAKQQQTRPQTIGYALADSPVAQATWIYQMFQDTSGTPGNAEGSFTFDQMLDDIMLYCCRTPARRRRGCMGKWSRRVGRRLLAWPNRLPYRPASRSLPRRRCANRSAGRSGAKQNLSILMS
jgi:hypothetical protein